MEATFPMSEHLLHAAPFLVIVAMALCVIYVGAWRSVESASHPDTEQMDHNSALRFPVVGSVVLLSLYVAYRYLPKYYLNLLLSGYFCFLGVFAVTETCRPWLGENKGPEIIAVLLCGYHFLYPHWLLNNGLGLCFSLTALEVITVGSTQIGVLLLSVLFFYDIFWVFGTEVMVSVATQVEGPIKLMVPKSLSPEATVAFHMLGLGDIVLPGLFISLMLRFDRSLAHVDANETKTVKKSSRAGRKLQKTSPPHNSYFTTAMVCYVGGLIHTICSMFLHERAQPALLYLVPWTVGGVCALAMLRGELSEWWSYTEMEVEDEGLNKTNYDRLKQFLGVEPTKTGNKKSTSSEVDMDDARIDSRQTSSEKKLQKPKNTTTGSSSVTRTKTLKRSSSTTRKSSRRSASKASRTSSVARKKTTLT